MQFNPEVVFKSFQDAIQLKPPLDHLEAMAVNSVLQKTVQKLWIIKELLQGPDKSEPSGYISPAIKMKERKKCVPPEAEMPESMLLSQKVKCHTSFLLDLLEETSIELEVQGSQVYLEYTLCCENLKLFDNQIITVESQDYNKLINYLEEKLKNCREKNQRTQEYLLESTGPCLDKAVVNVYAEENLGAIYGCIREVTRVEKSVLGFQETDRAVQELNEKLNFEVDEENVIHREIDSHLALLITELTNKVELWTNKYNSEINQLDIDLLQMKSQKDEQTVAFETLLKEFLEKREIMQALETEYNARERETEKNVLENKAANKIQRWWRNIIFRRNILKLQRMKSSKKNVENQKSKKKTKQ